MLDLQYDHASEALGNEAARIAYHERIRAALGAKPGESTLAAAERMAAEVAKEGGNGDVFIAELATVAHALTAAGIAPAHGSLAERVARLAADRDAMAAEVARLRRRLSQFERFAAAMPFSMSDVGIEPEEEVRDGQ